MTAGAAIAGWFSIEGGHATIGDEMARDALCVGLDEAGIPFRLIRPGDKTVASEVKIWVCGPVDRSYPPQADLVGDGDGWIITSSSLILDRLGPGSADVSTARDGDGVPTKADFAFLAPPTHGGFAALLLRGAQPEYRQDPRQHSLVAETVERAVVAAGLLPVALTTRIPETTSPAAFSGGLEAALAASSVVITSRLHGILHSVRAGRMPIVIDEIQAGGKVTAFGREFDLPILIPAADCTEARLAEALAEAASFTTSDASDLLGRARRSAERNRANVVSLIGERVRAS